MRRWSGPRAAAPSPSSRKNSRTPRVASVAARIRFHDRTAPVPASRLSASATGSGFSASRSSLRCSLATSWVRKHRLASPSPCSAMTARIRSAVRAGSLWRHQFQRHVVEREQHAVGAVTAVSPRRHARKQCLIGGGRGRDIADQNDDMIEPGDHDKRPRMVVARIAISSISVPCQDPVTAACRTGPVDGRSPPQGHLKQLWRLVCR